MANFGGECKDMRIKAKAAGAGKGKAKAKAKAKEGTRVLIRRASSSGSDHSELAAGENTTHTAMPADEMDEASQLRNGTKVQQTKVYVGRIFGFICDGDGVIYYCAASRPS